MDETDARIIEVLRRDARRSYADLGAAVKLSPYAVRQRMVKLIDAQELRILGVIEPEALGYRLLANVMIRYRGDPADFAREMRAYECVTFIASTVGRTNLLCEVASEDDARLTEFVAKSMATVPGVELFEISRLVDIVKWKGLAWHEHAEPPTRVDFDQLDDIDTQILRVLLYDPRIKVATLAARIDCPYPTVRRRVSALFDRGFIEAVAVTERAVPGSGALALVLLHSASAEAWRTGLAELPGVNIATRTIGAHAGLLEVMATDASELVKIVERIASFPGVTVAETLMIARSLVLPVSWRFGRSVTLS
ncbi:Lrp/AsnC family transcriptional regulator [Microbacterium lushaniae]|nr:Lrp/AsnC family transcriptional regulator [Microbacterium lushaniae]KAA9149394.1 Lrp/AsnC family transcriptional regulator [Microbacterium lushaniae]